MSCDCAVYPDPQTIIIDKELKGAPLLRGRCPDCDATVLKRCSEADVAIFEGEANPNTTKGPSYEESAQAPDGVGTSAKIESKPDGTANDRIIYEWLKYAGRFNDKTLDQHLLAIRYMEDLLEGKSFTRLTTTDLAYVRDDLKRRASAAHEEAWSKSTIKHRASHIKAFLQWLLRQNGYKRLPSGLVDYTDLPKAFLEKALSSSDKVYPTIEQAAEMVMAMPTSTLFERRERAMVAVAFLGALRADTLVSLRLGHIDIPARRIIQDAAVSRTKNGKSLMISWFPVPDSFSKIVIDWVTELKKMGFGPKDALFPPAAWLDGSEKPGLQQCTPMRSTHAATKAFQRASQFATEAYTPHAVKDTIGAFADTLQLSLQQRKAWSKNMGHKDEEITDRHYGKMSDRHRFELLESIEVEVEPPKLELSDEFKIAFFDRIYEEVNGKGREAVPLSTQE